jgi:hypothetical protein
MDDGVAEPFAGNVDRYRLPRFPLRDGHALDVKSVLATKQRPTWSSRARSVAPTSRNGWSVAQPRLC